MNIRGINSPQPADRPSPGRVGAPTPRPAGFAAAVGRDEVTLSESVTLSEAALSDEVREAVAGVSLRQRRLDDIKAAIEAGTYDTPERMDKALDRMLGDIA